MSLRLRINDDMKAAMKAKETQRLGALRLLLAAIKQREVDERIELDDASVLAVIDKMIKQRRDSISQFQSAGRQELADAENFEIGVLNAYMPQQLSAQEIDAEIAAAIASAGAQGAKDMGKVMGLLKTKLAGRADMSKVSGQVKAKLAG